MTTDKICCHCCSYCSRETVVFPSYPNRPIFNQDKQEPDWKTAVQIWNCDHADGKTIFYKVRDPIHVMEHLTAYYAIWQANVVYIAAQS